MASCSTCRFYGEQKCLRNAPAVAGDKAQWPAVSQYSWCGQHEELLPMVPRHEPAPRASTRITDHPRSAEDIHD